MTTRVSTTTPVRRPRADITMNTAPTPGLAVILEGADGSGKSAIVTEAERQLTEAGRRVHRVHRSHPRTDGTAGALVRSVADLFHAAHKEGTSFELLSLAAAAQYTALWQTEIAPAVQDGEIVLVESWWAKTHIRLALEARVHDHRTDLDAWQRHLLPPALYTPTAPLTVLVTANPRDRAAWYAAAGGPDPVYDPSGHLTNNPNAFADFTQHIAYALQELAAEQDWPVLANTPPHIPSDLAKSLIGLVDQQLDRRARRATAQQSR